MWVRKMPANLATLKDMEGGGEKGEKGRGDGEEGEGREGREGVLCNGTVCCGQSCSRKERDQSS